MYRAAGYSLCRGAFFGRARLCRRQESPVERQLRQSGREHPGERFQREARSFIPARDVVRTLRHCGSRSASHSGRESGERCSGSSSAAGFGSV